MPRPSASSRMIVFQRRPFSPDQQAKLGHHFGQRPWGCLARGRPHTDMDIRAQIWVWEVAGCRFRFDSMSANGLAVGFSAGRLCTLSAVFVDVGLEAMGMTPSAFGPDGDSPAGRAFIQTGVVAQTNNKAGRLHFPAPVAGRLAQFAQDALLHGRHQDIDFPFAIAAFVAQQGPNLPGSSSKPTPNSFTNRAARCEQDRSCLVPHDIPASPGKLSHIDGETNLFGRADIIVVFSPGQTLLSANSSGRRAVWILRTRPTRR